MKEAISGKYPFQLVVDFLRLTGYVISKTCWFIRYKGGENIPTNSSPPFLIAANHQTYIDPVWICLPMRRRIRYMAIEKAFNWRFVGSLIAYLGAFPVAGGIKGTQKAMQDAQAFLSEGAVLTVFPEGAREFADGKMLPFKTGVVRIAIEAGVPILPVTIRGGHRIWPQKQNYPRLFRRVEIIYHPLLHVSKTPQSELSKDLARWTLELQKIIAGDRG